MIIVIQREQLRRAAWLLQSAPLALPHTCQEKGLLRVRHTAISLGSDADKDSLRGHAIVQNGQEVVPWGCDIPALGHMHCAGG